MKYNEDNIEYIGSIIQTSNIAIQPSNWMGTRRFAGGAQQRIEMDSFRTDFASILSSHVLLGTKRYPLVAMGIGIPYGTDIPAGM